MSGGCAARRSSHGSMSGSSGSTPDGTVTCGIHGLTIRSSKSWGEKVIPGSGSGTIHSSHVSVVVSRRDGSTKNVRRASWKKNGLTSEPMSPAPTAMPLADGSTLNEPDFPRMPSVDVVGVSAPPSTDVIFCANVTVSAFDPR